MTSVVEPTGSFVVLPLVPAASAYPAPALPVPEPRRHRPDVADHDDPFPAVERASYDPRSGVTTFEWKSGAAWSIGAVRYDYTEAETYRTTDSAPARSSFLGVASHRVRPPGREFTLTTTWIVLLLLPASITMRARPPASALTVPLLARRWWW